MTRDQIIAALPRLSKADLQAVRGAADKLLGAGGTASGGPETVAYGALCDLLGANQPWGRLPEKWQKLWRTNWPPFYAFLTATFPESLENKVLNVSLMKLVFETMVDDLKERGVPVSVGAVITNMPRVEAAFDTAFPGYRQAGLSGMIVRSMTKGKK